MSVKTRTDMSAASETIQFGHIERTNGAIDSLSMHKAHNSYVYNYEMDYRLTEGEIKLSDFHLIENEE